jgi:hemolysin activation/secretion protein
MVALAPPTAQEVGGIAQPGTPFRWARSAPYGSADWEVILRAFADAGQATNNDRLPFENNETISSVGLGAELQVQQNISVRLDWGFALQDAEGNDETVSAGDSRLHFVATVRF